MTRRVLATLRLLGQDWSEEKTEKKKTQDFFYGDHDHQRLFYSPICPVPVSISCFRNENLVKKDEKVRKKYDKKYIFLKILKKCSPIPLNLCKYLSGYENNEILNKLSTYVGLVNVYNFTRGKREGFL